MFIRYVARRRTETVSVGCVALFLALWTPTLGRDAATAQRLFLLAGTPTTQGSSSYPVNLYSVTSKNRLELVRNIVSADAGLFSALDDEEGRIYVAFPHVTPTTVTVIHEEQPTAKDTVSFNPDAATLDNAAFGVSAGMDHASRLLCPLLREGRQESVRPSVGVYLVEVAGDRPKKGARVGSGDWSLYHSFRYEGSPGGPMGPGLVPLGYISGNHILIAISPPGRPFGNAPSEGQIDVGLAPPSIPINEIARPFYIVAASKRFFVISSTPGHSSVYVHDRVRNKWTKVTSAATVPYARRIFGPWLATIVEVWQPGDPQNADSPGCSNERNWGSRMLPNVREGYACGQGGDAYIPGMLILDNLEDGRRITLQTNDEDSEILDVRSDGLVLYRVNDSIFSAQIEGDKLGPSTLVVKDEDVPEVHWAFWSNARVETKAKPKTASPATPIGNN